MYKINYILFEATGLHQTYQYFSNNFVNFSLSEALEPTY